MSTRQCGLVVAFEGLDGAGKSTQCEILTRKFSSQGQPVHTLSHDREDPVDRMLLDLMTDEPVDVKANRFAIIATFLCRQEWVIAPQMKTGTSFIYDKYLLTFLAREVARGADVKELKAMIRQLDPPDLTIVLDVSPEVALLRKKGSVKYREAGLNLVNYGGVPVSPARFKAGEYPQEWVHQCYLDHQGQMSKALIRMLDGEAGYWHGKFGRIIVRLSSMRDQDDLAAEIWEAVCRVRSSLQN
jgi:thymidylate kinase